LKNNGNELVSASEDGEVKTWGKLFLDSKLSLVLSIKLKFNIFVIFLAVG
jgi:hypothetical protein